MLVDRFTRYFQTVKRSEARCHLVLIGAGAKGHWGRISGAERSGAGGHWGPRYWGRRFWGRWSLGQNFWGTTLWGTRSLGPEVLGQEALGQVVTGAEFLGYGALGLKVLGQDGGHRYFHTSAAVPSNRSVLAIGMLDM